MKTFNMKMVFSSIKLEEFNENIRLQTDNDTM